MKKTNEARGITLIILVIIIITILLVAGIIIFIIISNNRVSTKNTDIAVELVEQENKKTLGEVYNSGKMRIGSNLSYSANNQNDWIVFGKDNNGNILITTEKPVENGFIIQSLNSKSWLSYEEDLNAACAIYGGNIQGIKVTARSINIEDINNVTGFNTILLGLTFDEYTFGTVLNYENKEVDFYYPSAEEGTGWRKAHINNKTKLVENEIKFKNDWYSYTKKDNGGTIIQSYEYEGGANIEITLNNMEYVTGYGTGNEYSYAIASRFVKVSSDIAKFNAYQVEEGTVRGNIIPFGMSSSNNYEDALGGHVSVIRPVVVLPSTLQVEEKQDGTYDLVQ